MNGQMGRAFGKLARACACVCRGIACRWRQVDPAHHAGLGLLHPPFLISRCRRKGHSMNNIESTLSLGKTSPEPCYLMEELSFLGEPMRERAHSVVHIIHQNRNSTCEDASPSLHPLPVDDRWIKGSVFGQESCVPASHFREIWWGFWSQSFGSSSTPLVKMIISSVEGAFWCHEMAQHLLSFYKIFILALQVWV